MDVMREYLEGQKQGPTLQTALTWLSQRAFGAGDSANGLAAAYRKLLASPWARSLTSRVEHRPGYRPSAADLAAARGDAEGAAVPRPIGAPEVDAAAEERLAGIAALAVTDRDSLVQAARQFPDLLSMSPSVVAARVLALRGALPGCDVSRLLEQQPEIFYGASEAQLQQAGVTYRLLHDRLPGADVAEMVHEDPDLLFCDVEDGLAELRELWDVDAEALAQSDPFKLALAVRALSKAGPPHRL